MRHRLPKSPTNTVRTHPRAAAFLLRAVLEARGDAYIGARHPGLAQCTGRTKAHWLAQQLTPTLAGRYAAIWHRLSSACHYHQYALAPSAAELANWYDEVTHILAAFPA